MPQKLNKAGKMQDYIPKGNGDASGEYGTSNGTNKNFTTADKKKSSANVITENKSVVVENKGDFKNVLWDKNVSEEEKNKLRKTASEKVKELHKISNRIIENPTDKDKEEFNKKMDEYEKWEKENNMGGYFDYREYFKEKIATKGFKINKANIIDDDLTGKKEETRDYDSITYPKGTSKEYTMKVDKEYKEALPILKEYGIDIKEFGSWEDKDAFADKFLEIYNKYVSNRFKKETDRSNKAWEEKGYQRLSDALEKVEDKQYNDWWIKNKK